ncbi:hypothetical protein BDZ89DRAFT_1078883 [Hymenopellis radicata]|nr:hypothetical protein BDZ89DRAFT_1078883 [Hymenopellis radicata]
MAKSQPRLLWATACALLILAFVNVGMFMNVRRDQAPTETLKEYTYIGDDYPEYYIPTREIPDVVVRMEEARAYPIYGDDALERWASSAATGYGYVRLGPEKRAYAVSMFHQLHCLRLMRSALAGRYDDYTRGHTQHCLSYLRQMILCSPDLTLEPSDVLDRDFEVDRQGATHVCPDWGVMYEELEDNWNSWVAVRNETFA